MRWSSFGFAKLVVKILAPFLFAVALLVPSLLLLPPVYSLPQQAGQNAEKRVTFYSTTANYSLPVIENNGLDYVGLLEVLEPLGTVSAKTDGQRWNLRFNNVKCEFTVGSNRARIQKDDFDLAANFLLANGRGLVSLSSLSTLLPPVLSVPVTFRDAARRVFIGNSNVHFTATVNPTVPPALLFTFTQPVNPMIATEPGKLKMVFHHEPLLSPGVPILIFSDKTIHSATFRENNGTAEIEVAGTGPLFAKFSNDGRTITIVPAPQAATGNQASTTNLAASNQPPINQPPTPALPTVNSGQKRIFAVIDASHGGDERGAALTGQLAEKDVTLAFAQHLRQQLESRGLASLLLRDGDVTLTLDQRASQTNAANPAIYICLHAASDGNGVRLYTALLSNPEHNGPFLGWNTAQSQFLSLSRAVQTSVAVDLNSKHILTRSMTAPLRPLNNVTTAAIAIELAPGDGGVPDLTSSQYQGRVATSIAAGVLAAREQLEAKR